MGSDERCRKPGCGARKGRCSDWDCPEGDFVRMYEGRTDERAPEAREGWSAHPDEEAERAFAAARARHVRPVGRPEAREALWCSCSYAPAAGMIRNPDCEVHGDGVALPEAREALRERIAEGLFALGLSLIPCGSDHTARELCRDEADRIFALLSERPDAPAVRGLNEYEARLQSRLLNELATFEPDAPAERRECLCEKCGREYPVWFAPNELWNRYVRLPDGRDRWSFLCPTCFGMLVEAAEPNVVLMLTREPDAPGGERERIAEELHRIRVEDSTWGRRSPRYWRDLSEADREVYRRQADRIRALRLAAPPETL